MKKTVRKTVTAIILALTMLIAVPAEASAYPEALQAEAVQAHTVQFYRHVYHPSRGVDRFMKEEKFLFDEMKKYGLEKDEPYAFAYICWASKLNWNLKTGKKGRWYGYFQLDKRYWKEMCVRAGLKKSAKMKDPYNQIRVFCSEYAYYRSKSKTPQEAIGRFYTGGKRSKKIEKKIMNMFKEKVKVR